MYLDNTKEVTMSSTLFIVLGFSITFIMTTLGALCVYFLKKPSTFVNMLTIGFASGIMLSASVWSLLIPSIEYSEEQYQNLFILPVAIGFLLGGMFMVLLDKITGHFSNLKKDEGKNKAFKLFTAVTVHNIPEGLAVGFAFGSAFATNSPMFSAFLIALGIALQNFPEGLAVALPMHKTLGSKHKAFLYGTASGIVEPIFAILGFFLASQLTFLMPWLLSFSAGAMIYVVVEELLPELHINEKTTIGTWAFMIGFVLMMLLDLCL